MVRIQYRKKDKCGRKAFYVGLVLLTMAALAMMTRSSRLMAQSISIYSSIVGVVTDQSGAPVPGVKVTATNTETGIATSAVSDKSGYYRIDGLIAGTYNVAGEMQGFRTYANTGVILSSGVAVRADMILQLGAITQTVTVTAPAPLINTESGQISTQSSWNDLQFLPTVAPTFFTKLALAPGSSTGGPGYIVSFEGSRGENYSYAIDGSSFRFPQIAHGVNGNFNEYEQELEVNSVNNSAQYADVAEINITSKSGSNQWHGTGVEYYHDAAMVSRNPFVVPHTTGVFNNFAVGLGGPIKRNKAFFYGAYMSNRTASPTTITVTVPTAAMVQGNFSSFSTKIINPATGLQFSGNTIPGSQISPVSAAFISRFYPAANTGNLAVFQGNNYTGLNKGYGREDNIFGRVDYRFSDRNSMFASYDFDEIMCPPGRCATGNLPTVGPIVGNRRDQVASVSDLFGITPSLYNEFKLAFARDANIYHGNVYGPDVEKLLGLQGITPLPEPAIPIMSISGLTTVSQGNSNLATVPQNFSISDDVAYVNGRHRLKFGVMYMKGQYNTFPLQPDAFYGSFSFDGFASGNAFADFLLGIPHTSSQYNGAYYSRTYYRGNILGFYGEDGLQVAKKLTATIGLRYEYHQPYSDSAGRNYSYNPTTGQMVVPSSATLQLVSPVLSPSFQYATAQQAGYPSRLVSFSERNLAPRIGIVYRLKPSLVVRAGYGIYYDFDAPFQNNAAPFTPSLTYAPNKIVNGVPTYQFPHPFPSTPITGVGVGSLTLTPMAKSFPMPYTQQWNLTVEKQFGSDTSLRVSYVGNHSAALEWVYNINVPSPSTTPYSVAREPNPLFGPINYMGAGGNANYNALELYVQHRARHGLSMSSSFNWSKNLGAAFDMITAINANGITLAGGTTTLDPFDRELDYGPIPYERTLRSTTQLHWLVPVGKGLRYGGSLPQALQWVLGNWQTTDILSVSSGEHLTPTYSGYDSSGTGVTTGRPDLIGDFHVSNPSISEWFNPAAFAIPGAAPGTPLVAPSAPIGRYGTAGFGIITGPGYWQNDWGLVKTIPIMRERVNLHFFLLDTNVFNHINPSNPGGVASNPTGAGLNISVPSQAGHIFAIRSDANESGIGPRQYQIGVRIES